MAKRNARERRRVQAVNQAFYKLRKCIPIENRNKRVSKVKTLQFAIDYIRKLERILAHNEPGELAELATLPMQTSSSTRERRKKSTTCDQSNNQIKPKRGRKSTIQPQPGQNDQQSVANEPQPIISREWPEEANASSFQVSSSTEQLTGSTKFPADAYYGAANLSGSSAGSSSVGNQNFHSGAEILRESSAYNCNLNSYYEPASSSSSSQLLAATNDHQYPYEEHSTTAYAHYGPQFYHHQQHHIGYGSATPSYVAGSGWPAGQEEKRAGAETARLAQLSSPGSQSSGSQPEKSSSSSANVLIVADNSSTVVGRRNTYLAYNSNNNSSHLLLGQDNSKEKSTLANYQQQQQQLVAGSQQQLNARKEHQVAAHLLASNQQQQTNSNISSSIQPSLTHQIQYQQSSSSFLTASNHQQQQQQPQEHYSIL